MYKIADKIIKFIEETVKNWRVELTAEGKVLTGMKIRRSIFRRDAQFPLLFVITMTPQSYILRICTRGYKVIKLLEKINHLMYINGIKLLAKNEKELKTEIQSVRIYIDDIGMKFDIEKNVPS